MTRWYATIRSAGLLVQGGVLTGTMLLALAVAVPIAWRTSRTTGLMAASLAAGLCLTGAFLALAISHLPRRNKFDATVVLAGMLPRMGIPLLGGALLHFFSVHLAEGGFLYYLLVFYVIALTVEVGLTVPLVERPSAANPPRPRDPSETS